MVVLRFVTGIGLGGVLPNLVSLVTEFAPQRLRGSLTTLTFSSLPLRVHARSTARAVLIPVHGWPSLFYIGGAAPAAVAVVAFFLLPESPSFVAFRNGRAASGDATARPAAFAGLVGPGRTPTTALLVLVTGFNLFMLYFTLNWLPTLLTLAGLSPERALLATVLVNTSGCVGAVAWGRLIDRAGALPVMAGAGVLAALGMALLSVGHTHPGLLVAALVVAGMSVLGAVPGLYAVIASVYPTPMRSTGVGAVLGAGRVGSVLGPGAGGLLLALGWPIPTIS